MVRVSDTGHDHPVSDLINKWPVICRVPLRHLRGTR